MAVVARSGVRPSGTGGGGPVAEYARPADWPDVPLVDTDVHIAPRSIARWCRTCPRGGATTSARAGSGAWSPTSTRRGRRCGAIPGSRPADGPPGSDPDLLRAQLLDPWRHARSRSRTASTASTASTTPTGPSRWRARSTTGSRPSGSRPSRGCAARSSSPAQDPERAAARDRPGRRPPRVRAGPAAGAGRALRSGNRALLADLRGGRSGTAWRSASTPAARAATRSRRSAGRATTSRSTSALAQAFQAQVVSLVCEGVFGAVPATCRSCSSRRVHLAAAADVAAGQELEGPAPRGAVGGPAAVGDHPRVVRLTAQPLDEPRRARPAAWRSSTGSAATGC